MPHSSSQLPQLLLRLSRILAIAGAHEIYRNSMKVDRFFTIQKFLGVLLEHVFHDYQVVFDPETNKRRLSVRA